MASAGYGHDHPEGIFSLLDTDLYKLTMQCALLKSFSHISEVHHDPISEPVGEGSSEGPRARLISGEDVAYRYTNRTPQFKLNRAGFNWLRQQVHKLANVVLTTDELNWLKRECSFLNEKYLKYLSEFRFRPEEQVKLSFSGGEEDEDTGDVEMEVKGTWAETILYEIPLLALTSETYFRFVDRDWDHEGQEEKAYRKGMELLDGGCTVSEFGSRRRRDYRTHDLVMQGLCRASKEHKAKSGKAVFSGTSNVHFAQKYGVPPIGTVAHEWFMGIAAVSNSYSHANQQGLRAWTETYGLGVLAIALTDTFGTPAFLEDFKRPVPSELQPKESTKPPTTYAQAFTGLRQDSGDPAEFVKLVQKFYADQGITEQKTIVFSDSLNIELCKKYKVMAEDAGFKASFGIGTFFTNDFLRKTTGEKSVPLNIVIKLSSAAGHPAIKISDNIGKNTGDVEKVAQVKADLGYTEKSFSGGDEGHRWDTKVESQKFDSGGNRRTI